MREEAEGHSVDEDGLCRFSDLRPDQCAGHYVRASSDGRWLANRTWAD